MGVVERIMRHAERLTATERKIAAVLAEEPQAVAFGTVAQVAKRAGTSGPSVVRLAVKLGYDGFVGLQSEVQSELASQLAPARDRIRQSSPKDLVSKVHQVEADNLENTLTGLGSDRLRSVVSLLADRDRQIWVYPGTETLPVGIVLSSQLGQLREGVTLLEGSEVSVSKSLAGLRPGDLLVAVDIARYERSVLSMTRWAKSRGAVLVALTDGPLSPLASPAEHTLFISARGAGPFDSMVGGVALANLMAAMVAVALRASAIERLDAIEAAWTDSQVLVTDSSRARPAGETPLAPAKSLEA